MFEIIDQIKKEENLKIDENAEEAVFEVSGGDCRRTENILQSCAAISNNITQEIIYSMASVAKPKEIKEALETAVKGDFVKAHIEFGLSFRFCFPGGTWGYKRELNGIYYCRNIGKYCIDRSFYWKKLQ